MKLLKVFDRGLISPFQDFQYEKGEWYTCTYFDPDPDIECSEGFYATEIDGLPYCFNIRKIVHEVEVDGRSVEISQYKRRYEKIRVGRRIWRPELIRLAQEKSNSVGYKLDEVLFPFNPLTGNANNPTSKDIKSLEKYIKVWASVWDSSGASVWAYIGNLFPQIDDWEYIDHKPGEYPFQPCVDLWHRGFVPSFDGETWRLHSGKNAKIVYERESQ